MLAKFAAEFIDEHALLLYLPADGRFAEINPGTAQMLREFRVDEVFGDESLQAPIIDAQGDKAVERAIAQAQDRLPECLQAFARRGQACEALVKARFAVNIDGRSGNEYTWMTLKSVKGTSLTGLVLNEPLDPANPAKGSTATVPLDTIVDWAFTDEQGQQHGFFVEKFLRAKR